MKRVEVRELEYLLAVPTRYFARAAEQLGIAAPPLSRAMSQLERRLGTPLFDRTSRRVDLTAGGEVFAREARDTLAALDRAVRLVQRAGRTPLRVATPPGTGARLLREPVRAYLARFGSDTVELVFTRDQTAAVRDGRADVALVCSDVPGSPLCSGASARGERLEFVDAGTDVVREVVVIAFDPLLERHLEHRDAGFGGQPRNPVLHTPPD
ncbi:hypothetical protein AU194_19255 [Mycobacterium sp. GA-2829]|nr:hypothetical protein AU194_19255 [Mycobacterium sp. GA-2829]